jgi:hypothetical protein
MKLKEIYKKYPDQWVLVMVSKESQAGEVIEGEPIKASENRDEIYSAIGKVADGEHVATLYTGEILGKGQAFAF